MKDYARWAFKHLLPVEKKYPEESIVAECQKMRPYFIRAENFIAEHKDLIGCEFTLCNDGKIKSVDSRS